MNRVEMTVAFGWDHVGAVLLDNEQMLRIPKTGAQPGLYRFEITSRDGIIVYIGESSQISRRLQHYRTPGPSQQTNLRLNALLREHLRLDNQIVLSTVTDDISAYCAGENFSIDLSVKSERVLLEAAAILSTKSYGIPVLNL